MPVADGPSFWTAGGTTAAPGGPLAPTACPLGAHWRVVTLVTDTGRLGETKKMDHTKMLTHDTGCEH